MSNGEPNMKDSAEQSTDILKDSIDPIRRRLLLTLAAGTGTAMLGTLSWAEGVGAAGASGPSGAKTVRIVVFDDTGERVGVRKMPKVVKTAAEWKKQLSPAAYHITREAGTEPAFSGDYTKPDESGIYRCICCDTALYDAATQFHSGTGWPSFWQPIARENIIESEDHKLLMTRTAVSCKRCNAHLGHVFHDGPQPTGLRYCMDSVALHFEPTGGSA